jgi:two-component system, cell cycle response regulator DivK
MSTRILVVEDQPDNRQIIRKQRPDIILMDIQLPIMDGYEATRRIEAAASLRSIPIIAVTSYALSGEGQKARVAGCDDYVPKPFSPRQLLARSAPLVLLQRRGAKDRGATSRSCRSCVTSAARESARKGAWPSDMDQAPACSFLASTDLHQRQIRVRGTPRLGDDGSNSLCRGRTCRGGHLSRCSEIGRSLHRRLGDKCVLRWRGLPVMSWHSKPRQRFP